MKHLLLIATLALLVLPVAAQQDGPDPFVKHGKLPKCTGSAALDCFRQAQVDCEDEGGVGVVDFFLLRAGGSGFGYCPWTCRDNPQVNMGFCDGVDLPSSSGFIDIWREQPDGGIIDIEQDRDDTDPPVTVASSGICPDLEPEIICATTCTAWCSPLWNDPGEVQSSIVHIETHGRPIWESWTLKCDCACWNNGSLEASCSIEP